MSNPQISVVPDLEAVCAKGAELFANAFRKAVREKGEFKVALSGGNTPKRLYEILAVAPYGPSLPWNQAHIFWGDERCVPPESPDSNYAMTRETLLSKVKIPPNNVHRMKGELAPNQAASDYEADMRNFFAGGDLFPRLDFDLLGMGDDGHTASLFPGTSAVYERNRWVVGYFVPKVGMSRLSLTAPVHNQAKTMVVLVSGATKAPVLERVLFSPYEPSLYPAQVLKPVDGALTWLVDQAAAEKIKDKLK